MFKNFRNGLVGMCLPVMLVVAGSADAATTTRFTAHYTGNYFDRFNSGSGVSPYTTSNRITGSFIVDLTDDPNILYYGQVKSFSFSDGVQTLTDFDSIGTFSIFYPGSGDIYISGFNITASNPPYGNLYHFLSDNGSADRANGEAGEGYTYNVGYNWTITRSAVPEAASWTMLIAGFGLVGAGMRRHRSARNQASPIAAR